ncbi:MAG: putative sugar nucleotidyl transferase [Gemmatimonadota bacterium]|jgi:UDP-N-acetylglucosamine diphosphorylase/glucosamine-1-phosphate N-acetyltransferase
MKTSLYLFDDSVAAGFQPFALTRPVGELLFGAFLLRERAERYWGLPCSGHLSPSTLAGFTEEGAPPVGTVKGMEGSSVRILQSSRAAPWGSPPLPTHEPATLFLGDVVIGWILPEGHRMPDPETLGNPRPLPGSVRVEVAGRVLGAPWDLTKENGEQLRNDIPRFFPGYAADELPGCHVLGDGLLSLGSGVTVEPGSVFDLRDGPIRLGDGVTVRAHTRLAGPAYVGRDSTILGGIFSETSIGPVCRIRGEVECSLVLGYANKAHDGFLGHSYLGRWVNLGAFTANSDLKNSYGEVQVGSPGGPRATGLMKVGCFLGDHVKTGIGTLFNTGTVVGAGSNVFGGAMPPTYVPPFSWGMGHDLTEYRLDKFLEVARTVMGRRDVILDSGTEETLRLAWESTRKERVGGE